MSLIKLSIELLFQSFSTVVLVIYYPVIYLRLHFFSFVHLICFGQADIFARFIAATRTRMLLQIF